MVDLEHYEVDQFLRPITIPDKNALYCDIQELSRSIGGFFSKKYLLSCELLRETERLLANAVSLFEKGYFDAAFYLLREAIEVSTTFVYLYDLPEAIRDREYAAWKSENAKFAMQGNMLKELKKYGTCFPDFKEKMPAFFEKQKSAYARLNKFVHKQGFSRLYIARWRHGGKTGHEQDEKLLNEFLSLLSEAIGIAAVSRLMIDPMPILLGTEDMSRRVGDVLEEPFSPIFIKKYIEDEILAQYKSTQIYKNFKDDIMAKEELSEKAYDFVKWNFFDRKDIPVIMKQAHLLSFHHLVVLDLAMRYEEISIIHLYDGLLSFCTETQLEWERSLNFSSEDFRRMREGENKANISYKGGFMTIVKVNDCDFFLEHGQKFDAVRLMDLRDYSKQLNDTIKGVVATDG